jgi:hypothetical protein
MRFSRPLLASVHIERCGGTTFNSLLVRNFSPGAAKARCLSRKSAGVFTPADLTKMLLLSPAIRCVYGHPVVPWAGLERVAPNVRYITVLRDPIKRYLSHYQYRVEKKSESLSLEEFAANDEYANFQTKKIAGCEDVDKAKEMLASRFLVVGLTEDLDTYLLMLKRKLQPTVFDPRYRRLNVGRTDSGLRKSLEAPDEKARRMMADRNQADIELYRFATEEILPRQREEYGPGLEADLAELRRLQAETVPPRLPRLAALATRYNIVVFGLWRLVAGLTFGGAY